VVSESGRERAERDLEIARIDPEARESSAWPENTQTGLECRLCAQGFDRYVNAPTIGDPHDLGDRIGFLKSTA
jgi:hypothetical protein